MKKVKYENVSKLFYGINNNFNKPNNLYKIGFTPFFLSGTKFNPCASDL